MYTPGCNIGATKSISANALFGHHTEPAQWIITIRASRKYTWCYLHVSPLLLHSNLSNEERMPYNSSNLIAWIIYTISIIHARCIFISRHHCSVGYYIFVAVLALVINFRCTVPDSIKNLFLSFKERCLYSGAFSALKVLMLT